MQKDVISPSIDDSYYLSRRRWEGTSRILDKFDRAFGEYFKGHRVGRAESSSTCRSNGCSSRPS